MKIILLRHEKREDYPGFFSNLTEKGFKDSKKLIKKFEKYKIDEIYCSPLMRTLQTIYSYASHNHKKVNPEYGLYEYKNNPYFLFEPKPFGIKDINNHELKKIINKNYKSYIRQKDIVHGIENEQQLKKRVNKFLRNILKFKNKTILLVSHKGTINKIKQLLNNDIHIRSSFPKGHFEVIDL
jgi:broad specificity phosphatase PhoE